MYGSSLSRSAEESQEACGSLLSAEATHAIRLECMEVLDALLGLELTHVFGFGNGRCCVCASWVCVCEGMVLPVSTFALLLVTVVVAVLY